MTKRKQTPEPPGPSIRRWFRIGPGLIVAIAIGVYVWTQSPADNRAPRIERTRVDIPDAPPAAPDPDWLMAHARDLSITAEQQKRLTPLHARWQKETEALRAELDRAAAEFERRRAQGGSDRATLESLRAEAGPVSELSSRLAAARRVWWEEAAAVLTPQQRKSAEEGWRDRLTLRR